MGTKGWNSGSLEAAERIANQSNSLKKYACLYYTTIEQEIIYIDKIRLVKVKSFKTYQSMPRLQTKLNDASRSHHHVLSTFWSTFICRKFLVSIKIISNKKNCQNGRVMFSNDHRQEELLFIFLKNPRNSVRDIKHSQHVMQFPLKRYVVVFKPTRGFYEKKGGR